MPEMQGRRRAVPRKETMCGCRKFSMDLGTCRANLLPKISIYEPFKEGLPIRGESYLKNIELGQFQKILLNPKSITCTTLNARSAHSLRVSLSTSNGK